jgi:WD40 repeat protein
MDKQIRVYHADTYDLINTFAAHSSGVRSLSLTEDKNIISGGEDKLIKVWNKSNFSLMQVIEGHDDYIRVVCGIKD